MTIGAIQELQWQKEMFVDDIVRKAEDDDFFHEMITHEIAKLITSERSGALLWLYGFFSVLHKPMSPIEFFVFWDSLDDWERSDFARFAIRNRNKKEG